MLALTTVYWAAGSMCTFSSLPQYTKQRGRVVCDAKTLRRQMPLCQNMPWARPESAPSAVVKKSVLVPPITLWPLASMRLNCSLSFSRPILKLVVAPPGTVLVMLTVSSDRSTCITNTAWGEPA